MNDRRRTLLLFVLLYVVSFAVRVYVTRERVSAGHGDVAAYFHVAQNLFEGRGFVQDVVFEFLEQPTTLPTASNSWWLPLPSIIAYLGMKVAGEASWRAAQYAMIALSSLLPLLCFAAGWFLLRCRTLGFACGLLAAGFHLYLDQPNATLSHGPYALFCGAALMVVIAWPERPKLLSAFGVLFGLTYLCRGDSQVLVAALALSILWYRFIAKGDARRDVPWRQLGLSLAGFLLVVVPWWVRNSEVFGTLMPKGLSRVAWARRYEDWFTSTPDRLTPKIYFEWGKENIIEQKLDGLRDALTYTPFMLYRSVSKERVVDPTDDYYQLVQFNKYVLSPLLALGLIVFMRTRPRAVVFMLVHLALLAVVYGIVFPAVGRESYRSSMFSIVPIQLAAIIGACAFSLKPLEAHSKRSHRLAVLLLGLSIGAINVVTAEPYLDHKYQGVEGTLAPYREFGIWAKANGLENDVFMVRNPWQFTVETGMKAVMIPSDGVGPLLEQAKVFRARWLVDEFSAGESVLKWRPALQALLANGTVKKAYEGNPPPRFGLYLLPK